MLHKPFHSSNGMHVEQPVEVEFQHHHFQIDINHDLSHAVLSIILFH